MKKFVPSDAKLNVPLEWIMGSNHKAQIVCCAVAYEFVEHNVIIVQPVYKNQLHFKGVAETYLSYWQGKYKTSYNANKAHCIAVFKYIANMFKFDISGINKDVISHVADAFCEIFGIYWAAREKEVL